MAAIMLQANPSFHIKFSEKTPFLHEKTYEKHIFVQIIASPITTTRRVFYPLVNIIFYYLETWKSF